MSDYKRERYETLRENIRAYLDESDRQIAEATAAIVRRIVTDHRLNFEDMSRQAIIALQDKRASALLVLEGIDAVEREEFDPERLARETKAAAVREAQQAKEQQELEQQLAVAADRQARYDRVKQCEALLADGSRLARSVQRLTEGEPGDLDVTLAYMSACIACSRAAVAECDDSDWRTRDPLTEAIPRWQALVDKAAGLPPPAPPAPSKRKASKERAL